MLIFLFYVEKVFGIKVGEMERDALLEYGASYLQQERMVISSDAYQAIICRECEMFASTDIANTSQTCRRCNTATFTRVRVPYAFKLLTNYLNAANLKVTFKTKRV
jgi:DNA-directed RNA polymerase beta subunit